MSPPAVAWWMLGTSTVLTVLTVRHSAGALRLVLPFAGDGHGLFLDTRMWLAALLATLGMGLETELGYPLALACWSSIAATEAVRWAILRRVAQGDLPGPEGMHLSADVVDRAIDVEHALDQIEHAAGVEIPASVWMESPRLAEAISMARRDHRDLLRLLGRDGDP